MRCPSQASRNFGVTIAGLKTDALVPYADMLNHYRPRETRWTFEADENNFSITSIKDLTMGQQVRAAARPLPAARPPPARRRRRRCRYTTRTARSATAASC